MATACFRLSTLFIQPHAACNAQYALENPLNFLATRLPRFLLGKAPNRAATPNVKETYNG
jgi:hypothetical protein